MLDFIFTISYNILHELVVLLLTDYAQTLVMVPNRALLFWKLNFFRNIFRENGDHTWHRAPNHPANLYLNVNCCGLF